MLWDLNEAKHLYSLEAGDVVNALVFSPNRYWLCAATASCIKIFDLESKCVGLYSDNFVVMLTLVVFTGRSSTSSSQNALTPARLESQYVFRLPGQRMARHCSVASPTTSSVSGVSPRDHIVGLVVYYMACCTPKIGPCCNHLFSLHWTARVIDSERSYSVRIPVSGETYISIASRRFRTRSSYVYLSIPPKFIVMAPVEMLTCNSQI